MRPDRYYVMSDAGSLYFDDEHADGFETPAAAADWARAQTLWKYGSELDFSDGVTSVIMLGSEVNSANDAWQAWPTPAAMRRTRTSKCATTQWSSG